MVRRGSAVGGIPKPGEALTGFGLDIGRGTSGWADGADAVRGHENFLRDPLMLILIVSSDDARRKRTGPASTNT